MKPSRAVSLSVGLLLLLPACRTITPGPAYTTPVPPREQPLPDERRPIEPPQVPTPTTGASPTDPNTLKRNQPDQPLWKP